MLEAIFEFLAELLLQILGELLAELVGRSVSEPFRRSRPVNPWLAMPGYAIFGAVAGAISLGVLPALFIADPDLRIVNLLLTPLLAGGVMALFGAWRRKRDLAVIRLDSFAYGYCFALAMGLVRFWCGA